ncbi:MAG: TonB family protein [Terriglobales bacterium]|jgi:TonB family protein
MKRLRTLLVAAGMTFASADSLASDFKVIANSSVKEDTISAEQIKRVYLEEDKALADGVHVVPVLEKDGPVHEAFVRRYLGVSQEDLQAYYRTLLFTGRGSMPKALASDEEVVAYVARTRGAIGYVSGAASTDGVKTLAIGDTSNATARRLMIRIEPDYPETLKRMNIGGTVRLRVLISAKGNVEEVRALGGNPILCESAARAVKKWVYAAASSRTVTEVSILFDGHGPDIR